MGPQPSIIGVLMRGVETKRCRHLEKKVMWHQKQRLKHCSYKPRGTKDWWHPPEVGRGKEEFSPKGFRGIMALLTPWFLTSGFQTCEAIGFCCFKPPSLWCFAKVSLGNEYTVCYPPFTMVFLFMGSVAHGQPWSKNIKWKIQEINSS